MLCHGAPGPRSCARARSLTLTNEAALLNLVVRAAATPLARYFRGVSRTPDRQHEAMPRWCLQAGFAGAECGSRWVEHRRGIRGRGTRRARQTVTGIG